MHVGCTKGCLGYLAGPEGEVDQALRTLYQQHESAVLTFLAALHKAPLKGGADTHTARRLRDFMILPAVISIEGSTDVATVQSMLDSGALDATFIDGTVIKSLPFLSTLRRPCHFSVRLGDGKDSTQVDVREYIMLNVECKDHEGMTHVGKGLKCLVMPSLAHPLILGLPDLVKHFPHLFISHLMAAIRAAHGTTNINNSNPLPSTSLAYATMYGKAAHSRVLLVDPMNANPTSYPGATSTKSDSERQASSGDGCGLNDSLLRPTGVKDLPKRNQITAIGPHLCAATPKSFDWERAQYTTLAPLATRHVSFRQSNTQRLDGPVPAMRNTAGGRRLRVMTLNVNGLNNALIKGLPEFLQTYEHNNNALPDVLVLTEIKLTPKRHAAARQTFLDLGYPSVEINSNTSYAGILIATRVGPDPVYMHGLPGYGPDQESRTLTATWADPPMTVVGAYFPFNNITIVGRTDYASDFRMKFTHHIQELREGAAARGRSVLVMGDLQVAPTALDQSQQLPETAGSTTRERADHNLLLSTGLTDVYRHLHPEGRDFTCHTTWPGWTGSRHTDTPLAHKRIDAILTSPDVIPLSATIHHGTADFTDHSAAAATVLVNGSAPITPPTHPQVEKEEERQGGSTNSDGANKNIPRQQRRREEREAAKSAAKRPQPSELKDVFTYQQVKDIARDIALQIIELYPGTPLDETTEATLNTFSTETSVVDPEDAVRHLWDTLDTLDDDDHAVQGNLNVLYTERQQLVDKVLAGKATPIPQAPDIPEDSYVPLHDLPQSWHDAVKEMTLEESHRAYIERIPQQLTQELLDDPEWMKLMLSEKAIKTFGEPMDGRGIQGIPDLELRFREHDMPPDHRAQCRNVPAQLVDIVEKHIEKFIDKGLFSRSKRPHYTSPTVIAPKATDPFFRLAVDYRWLNQFIAMIHAHVPIILEEIHKAKGWKYFGDIDWTEAFHQIKLAEKTSEMLSIITILGPIKPNFMMEGVAPASSVLQNVVADIFSPLRGKAITMFDNILTGAEDIHELRKRVEAVLDTCYKHNIKLNFKKTHLGKQQAKFFGYELYAQGYRIDEERKRAIADIPFPGHGKTKRENTKQVRSFLGFSVYFMHFVERYAHYAAPLHDMTRDDFNWDKSTWTRDYEEDFRIFKEKLAEAMDVIYPDFSLEWILLADASDIACGWILLQLRPQPDGSVLAEPISVGSEKFSAPAAHRWPINEKEAYGLLRGLKTNRNLLCMKPFFIATDHWNLTMQEKDPNKKLGRYMLEFQQYPTKGQLPIKGEHNNATDHLSRMYPKEEQPSEDSPANLTCILLLALSGFCVEGLRSTEDTTTHTLDPVCHTRMHEEAKEIGVTLASLFRPNERQYLAAASRGVFGDEVKQQTLLSLSVTSLCNAITNTEYIPTCGLCNINAMDTRPSSKVFQYKVDNLVSFQGRLANVRCVSKTAKGAQCKAGSVIGTPHCWNHLLAQRNLRILDSTHGKGLFAMSRKLRHGDVIFKKEETIVEYSGEELTTAQVEERYGNNTAPYTMSKHKGLHTDAALQRGVGSLTNHSSRPNARAGVSSSNKIVLIAKRSVRNGEEITINYNAGGGNSPYIMHEPGVTHTTKAMQLSFLSSNDQDDDDQPRVHLPPLVDYSPQAKTEMFQACHGGVNGHWGRAKTWATLNKVYPGHGISMREVGDLILACGTCQKHRLTLPHMKLQPRINVVDPPDLFHAVSVDGMPISPTDDDGMKHINIVKRHGTKVVTLHASRDKTEDSAADAILVHRIRYGRVTNVTSDPGSDYTGKVVAILNAHLGIKHRVGLVNRPQGQAIERDVAEVKRFLRDLANHHHLVKHWSSPRVLAVAEYMLNDDPEMPSSITPYELTYGGQDADLQRIINEADPKSVDIQPGHKYLVALLADIQAVREVYGKHRADLLRARTKPNLDSPQNYFHPGDLVLKDTRLAPKRNTFAPKRLGPYVVISHISNTVLVRSLVDSSDQQLDVTDCVMFDGSMDQAIELARQDDHQFVVDAITAWRGNPSTRSTLSFRTTFQSGDTSWMQYTSTDIKDTTAFQDYCKARPALQGLLLTAAQHVKACAQINQRPMVYTREQTVFLDMRHLSHTEYQLKTVDLAHKYNTSYMLEARVTRVTSGRHPRLHLTLPVINEAIVLTHADATAYVATSLHGHADPVQLITQSLLHTHPCIQTASLPSNWDNLTPEQAQDLLDPFH